MSSSSSLFRKWRRWLNRIYDGQLRHLLVNQQVFHQLQEALRQQSGGYRTTGAHLAAWMVQGYVAFASTTIRRMVEPAKKSWKSISLRILLDDLKCNDTLLTRKRYRRMYRASTVECLADEHFDCIVRKKGAPHMTASRIERDIVFLKRATDPVRSLVNKVIAHTEEDRRRIGRTTYTQLDTAIESLETTFKRYQLLITGANWGLPRPRRNVAADLRKIWP